MAFVLVYKQMTRSNADIPQRQKSGIVTVTPIKACGKGSIGLQSTSLKR